jgi:hypothetical protein
MCNFEVPNWTDEGFKLFSTELQNFETSSTKSKAEVRINTGVLDLFKQWSEGYVPCVSEVIKSLLWVWSLDSTLSITCHLTTITFRARPECQTHGEQ